MKKMRHHQLHPEQIRGLRAAFDAGLTQREAVAKTGVCRDTAMRYYRGFREGSGIVPYKVPIDHIKLKVDLAPDAYAALCREAEKNNLTVSEMAAGLIETAIEG